ncbi:MAG: hypothetical protein RL744_539 [Pseudomonadota bacterium]|jgi:hypothetical protein
MDFSGVFLEWYRFNIDLSVNPKNQYKCPEIRLLEVANCHLASAIPTRNVR